MPETPIPEAFTPTPGAATSIDLDALENVLTLDGIISGTRLPERTVRIYKRGDLLGQLDDVEGRLEELVDDEGEPLEEDLGLGEQSEIVTLTQRSRLLRTELAKDSFGFKVRAMGSTKWKQFVAQWEDPKTRGFKDGMNDALIIASAASPPIPDAASLERFRDAFNHNQISAVFQAAWIANTKSGLDIPKLPDFLAAQKHEERS